MNGSGNGSALNGSACDIDPYQQKVLSGVRGAAGVVCLIPTAITLCLFICTGAWKKFRHRIVLFLTTSTVLYLIIFVMQISTISGSHEGLCEAIGFFVQYFGWQELLLVSSITIYFYIHLVKHSGSGRPRPQEKESEPVTTSEITLFLTLIFVPLIPAGLVFIKDGYGETRGWCWIQSYNSDCTFVDGILRQIFLWYIWFVSCGILSIVFFIKIILAMRSNAKEQSGTTLAEDYNEKKKDLTLLLIYPVIFLVVNSFELVSWIFSYGVSDKQVIFTFWVIYGLLSPVSAAAIPVAFSIVYCRSVKDIHSTCSRPRCNCCHHQYRREEHLVNC